MRIHRHGSGIPVADRPAALLETRPPRSAARSEATVAPRCGHRERPRGGVVTQRTANPCTPVRFRARPPNFFRRLHRSGPAGRYRELSATRLTLYALRRKFASLTRSVSRRSSHARAGRMPSQRAKILPFWNRSTTTRRVGAASGHGGRPKPAPKPSKGLQPPCSITLRLGSSWSIASCARST